MAEDRKQNNPDPPASAERDPAVEHVADETVLEPESPEAGIRPPLTPTGVPVEDQVRKEWDPNKAGGLPMPLPAASDGSSGR